MDNFVIKLAAFFLLSIFSLASLLILCTVKQRRQMRLRRSRLMASYHRRNEVSWHEYDNQFIEPERYSIGDVTCQFNAHSPYIRCAVNPSGPCQNCPHYEAKE
jgi:hypothetical protein